MFRRLRNRLQVRVFLVLFVVVFVVVVRGVRRAVGDAGINMRGLSAMTSGKNFVAYLGFDSEPDADRAMAALKNVKTAGGTRAGATRARSGARRAAAVGRR